MHLRKFVWIPAVFAAVHSLLVIYTHIVILTSDDSEASMGWLIFGAIDFAIVPFLDNHTDPMVPLLILGGFQWIVIGVLVAAIRCFLDRNTDK